MADVSATWTSPTGSQCVATGSGGHSVVMDAPNGRAEWSGFKPSELLLAALLGCTGVDFTSILAKQRQVVTAISAEAHGEQDGPAVGLSSHRRRLHRARAQPEPARSGSCAHAGVRRLLFGRRDARRYRQHHASRGHHAAGGGRRRSLMDHQVLEAGSAAMAEIIDELARVHGVRKCMGCECFLAVVQAIDKELAPILIVDDEPKPGSTWSRADRSRNRDSRAVVSDPALELPGAGRLHRRLRPRRGACPARRHGGAD